MLTERGQLVYGKGKKDLMFCAFYTAFFTFVRELTMEMVLAPLAKRAGLKKSKHGRFMEQCYSCVQFTIFGIYGVVGSRFSDCFLRVVSDVTNTDMAISNGTILPGISA